MKAGQPLTDEDRWPWLDNIHDFVSEKIMSGNIILACSALKQVYRNRLSKGIEQYCRWVFLNGSCETIAKRMQNRVAHYMPGSLLQSQFDVLEIPANAIQADIAMTPAQIVNQIISNIN